MRTCFALVGLILGLLFPWTATAQDRALHWERYDYDIEVLPNGDLRFTETQVLAIDRGSFRFGTLSFDTGEYGRVRNVAVAENGEPYLRGSDQPGTFVASDDGEQFRLTYVFRDPNAQQHPMTISYTVGRALVAEGDRVDLTWNFFCGAEGCPPINAGSIRVRFPGDVDAALLDVRASGALVRQAAVDGAPRWELAAPIQGSQVRLSVTFPRALLAPEATFRGGAETQAGGQPLPAQPGAQPALPAPINPVPAGLPISPLFCFIIMLVLLFVFSGARRSTRRRGGYAPPPRPQFPSTPFGGLSMPRPRRRRGWGGRGYGGWGIPPIIIPPPSHRSDNWSGPFSAPPDTTSGGGGSSWGDSGGGGSSWSDSGGGGSSWSNTSGGGSSWGGGGGGGGGDSGGSGGGGDNNSSSFG